MSNRNSISLDDKQLFINHKPFIMYSGEIHYFRIPPAKWALMIKRAKEANLNTISTYIPWRWHEYKEGKFDFTGRTKKGRNLIGFLELVKEAGLYLSLRAGPMCHGEIIDDGLPDWLMNNYPQIRLKKPDGSLFRGSMISLLHPDYLKLVEKWYSRVIPIISERQFTKGGNVIILQLDNEISMINWLTKIPDTNKSAQKKYHNYLKSKYRNIAELNRAYSSSYKSFSQIKYPAISYDKQPGIIFWDWVSFWREFYSDYYLHLSRLARNQGIDIPLVANIAHFADVDVRGRAMYSLMTTSMFKQFPKKVEDLILGGAYQMRRLDYENFHDVYLTSEAVKMTADKKSPSFCVEMQSGIMFDKPLLYPQDVSLNTMTAMASGLNGFNAYMFASGRNQPHMGGLGTLHNWQAAVALDGSKRPHYKALKRWGRIIKSMGADISAAKKEADVNVGLYLPYYETEFLKGSFINNLELLRNKFLIEGLLRLLSLSSVSYEFIDIKNKPLSRNKPLIVFSLNFMDDKTQKKIADFVSGGGKVLIGPFMPSEGLDTRKADYLKRQLEIKTEVLNSRFIKKLKDLFMIEEPNYALKHKGSFKSILQDEAGNNLAISFKHNKGRVVAHGFGLISMFDYYQDIFKKLITDLNIKRSIASSSALLPAALRSSAEGGFLFAANYHQIPLEGFYEINIKKKGAKTKKIRLPKKGLMRHKPRTDKVLPVNFKVSDELMIISATVQILKITKAKAAIKLDIELNPGAREEIVIKSKKDTRLYLDHKFIKKVKADKLEIAELHSCKELARLTVKKGSVYEKKYA